MRRNRFSSAPKRPAAPETSQPAYKFARYGSQAEVYRDLSQDGDDARLQQIGLPRFHTPAELADWLEMPVGKVAWLIYRFNDGDRPLNEQTAHYHFRWIRKHSGGWRLIEAPKPVLKEVQQRILREILEKVPAHRDAHGFLPRRSVLTNAQPHTGNRAVLKMDLENFYATVNFNRVVALFRSLGYSREAANWLGRLTTSVLPINIPFPAGEASALLPFLPRHLPQGAPTSPMLANLSAYSLDVRLGGLARSFQANYTRYADDLTFSGPDQFLRSLHVFIPLATQVIRKERFRVHRSKRKVLRSNQRQTVTGVVVNQKPNVSRKEYDRLKATLHNCVRYGPRSQNHNGVDDFAAHLRGRVAHVQSLNPNRGAKLLQLYQQIDWWR